MKRFISMVALVAFSMVGLSLAQQTPSTSQSPSASQSSPAQAGSASQQASPTSSQSARSFEGKVTKSGDQWVLQDNATQTSYKLDDQDKAKQYDGKNVKVMATMDASSNTLHVVDIMPADAAK